MIIGNNNPQIRNAQFNSKNVKFNKENSSGEVNTPKEEYISSSHQSFQEPDIKSFERKGKYNKKTEENNNYKDGKTGENLSDNNGNTIAMLPSVSSEIIEKNPGKAKMFEAFHNRLQAVLSSGSWITLTNDNNIDIKTTGFNPVTPKEMKEIDNRFEALASDPAKGGKIGPGTIEEATIAFVAEKGGIIPPPVERETTGLSEFIDKDGNTWDVKSPLSPEPGAKWVFDPNHQIEKIRHDLSQGDRTLLNLSRCNKEDTNTLLNLLKQELTEKERSLIFIIANKEAL